MTDNFNQTVDLRKKSEKYKPAPALEKIYEAETDPARDFKKISRPGPKKDYSRYWRVLVFILAVLVISFAAYRLFFKGDNLKKSDKNLSWYAVKLADGEIFYGQIVDVKSDPVVMNNVYYNYDQIKSDKKEVAETDKIVLVKSGQQTYGPSGTRYIVRSQVLYMEPLKADSKVLKAILEYEK